MVPLEAAEERSLHPEPDSVFSAEQTGDWRRRFVTVFLGIQRGKPLASLRMRGVNFEMLGINGACGHRELRGLEQFSELNVDRLGERTIDNYWQRGFIMMFNPPRPKSSPELPQARKAILSLCVSPAAYANRGS